MNKTTRVTLCAVVTLMVLMLTFVVPSGEVTQGAQRQYSEWQYEKEEQDLKLAGLQMDDLIASAVFSDILPSENVALLPIDFSAGKTPIEENFTETGYRDDTIIVELEQRRMFDSDVFIAYIKIATPNQLRTATAGNSLRSTRTNQTTKISKNYNGIVAVNGDYFTGTYGGYIVRQGEEVRKNVSDNIDLMLVDQYGDFHLIPRGKTLQNHEIDAFESQYDLVNGFFFGPALVIDGEMMTVPDDYQFAPNTQNPRACIAQIAPLTYAVVVVNGRSNDSVGVTMQQFAEIMMEIGVEQAYNLDGGNSATLAFNGKVYNDKPQAERDVSDIIYFATATE